MAPRELARGKLLLRTGAPRASAEDALLRRAAARESWRIVQEQRTPLKRCYRESLSRNPERVVRMTLRLESDASGRIVARRSDGAPLGDAEGDACIRQVLFTSSTVDPRLLDQPLAEVPLVFYVHAGRTDAPKRYRSGGTTNEEGFRRRAETAGYNEARARDGQVRPGPWSRR